jgi:hypothetical protein
VGFREWNKGSGAQFRNVTGSSSNQNFGEIN